MESIDGNVAVKRGSFEVYVETYKDEVTLDIDFDFEGVVYIAEKISLSFEEVEKLYFAMRRLKGTERI